MAVVLTVVIVGVATLLMLQGIDAAADFPTVMVTRGDFNHEVVAEGILEAEVSTPLSSPSETRRPLTVSWLEQDGAYVHTDDVVVRFDPTEMELSLLDGQSEKETVENKLSKQQTEQRAALKNLDSDARLAALELDFAENFQSKDQTIFSRSEIIESEIDQDLAQQHKTHAVDNRKIREDLSQVEQDLLELEKQKAELKIEQAEDGLRSLEVRVPHDGIFVLKRDWRGETQVGETVWPGQPIAELPQLDVMQAKLFVLEADAGELATECKVTIVLDAYPTEEYAAEVSQIATLAQPRTRSSPVQYFEVVVKLARTEPERMKPGQRVTATLHIETLEDVLSVPREAITVTADGERVVHRRTRQGFEAVPVELGSYALGRVVVESGLDAGDIIALGDPTEPGNGVTDDDTTGGAQTGALP